MFALSLPVLLLAVGGGIDYTRATTLHQQTASALELACKSFALKYTFAAQSNRYLSYDDLAAAVNKQLADDKVAGVSSAGSFIDFTKSYLKIVVKAGGNSPNMFAGVLGYDTIPIYFRRECPAIVGASATGSGSVMFVESFETGHGVWSNDWGVLQNWNNWTTRDAGIEINGMPQLAGNVIRFGNFFAELDSHCYVANCNSNSTMSREFDLTPGDYEIRYWYTSRIRNSLPNYANKTICGKETDVSWATWEDQTNRIEVYFEKPGTYSATSSFKAASMVDVCVYADQWVERKIALSVSTSGKYRISWRAAGKQDTVGGLIDYLRFCSRTCP